MDGIVVWGADDNCCLFDKTYDYKGHAIRRAKVLIESGHDACVVRPTNATFFQVRKGNALTRALIAIGRAAK